MNSTPTYTFSPRLWILIIITYSVPVFIEFLDKGQYIFHSVQWFVYIMPTLILVNKNGIKYGLFSTGISISILCIVEALQPEGIVRHDIIILGELLFVNVLITFIVGKLVNKKVDSEEKYKYLVEKSMVGVFLIHNDQLVYINNWIMETLGLTTKELIGKKFWSHIETIDAKRVKVGYHKLINRKVSFLKEEIQVRTTDGEQKFLKLQASLASVKNGDLKIIGTLADVTEKKNALKEIKYIAYHDALTGLLNMNYLNKYLIEDFELNKANGLPTSLMFINLDRFKLFNDSYGHPVGDQLIKSVSKRLDWLIKDLGTVIRAGGDEFILYLPTVDKIQAKSLAKSILKNFMFPIFIDSREIRIEARIGIHCSQVEDTFETLVMKASSALHFSKEHGQNQLQFYSDQFGERANRKLQIEQGLRKALYQDTFQLFYQPKLDLYTNHITGMEALIRWNDPILGIISPAEFIPIAEETGIIVPLGKWILETACKQTSTLQKFHHSRMHVCVNISGKQFLQDDFVLMVQQILQESELPPESLNLEITEGIALYNICDTINKLEELKQLGVTISLDDFGTGYSSLRYLKALPIDYLKIDRSFINEIEHNPDAAIIQSTISLAHSLGLRVVAEGVEVEKQQVKLAEMGCDEIQGYYFAKPMKSFDLIPFLESN